MADHAILELSPGWHVLADEQQWILSKAQKSTREAANGVRQPRSKAVGYVGGQKRTLLRLARENSAPVTPEARQVIDTWPDRFLDWHAQQDRRAAA